MPIFPPFPLPDPPVVPVTTKGERWHGLDLLRGVAMMLGVYLHGAIPYLHARPLWAVHDPSQSMFFDLTVGAIHGFRMQLFFLLAGFFAGLMAARRGMGVFLRNRAWRIGLPFVLGMLVLLPMTLAAWFWAAKVTGQQAATPAIGEPGWRAIPTAHLWFLQYLLVFYVLAGLTSLVNGRRRWPRLLRLAELLLESRWKVVWLPLLTVGWVFGGPGIGEVEEAGARLLPGLRGLGYYGFYFAFGWFCFRGRGSKSGVAGFSGWYAGLAVIGFAGYGICVDRQLRLGEVGFGVELFGNLFAELYAWTAMMLCFGVARRWFSAPRAWARQLADASYWFYLAHLPLVIVLQGWVAGRSWNAFTKCALVVGATTVVLWVSYRHLVRPTWVGRMLNGPRAR